MEAITREDIENARDLANTGLRRIIEFHDFFNDTYRNTVKGKLPIKEEVWRTFNNEINLYIQEIVDYRNRIIEAWNKLIDLLELTHANRSHSLAEGLSASTWDFTYDILDPGELIKYKKAKENNERPMIAGWKWLTIRDCEKRKQLPIRFCSSYIQYALEIMKDYLSFLRDIPVTPPFIPLWFKEITWNEIYRENWLDNYQKYDQCLSRFQPGIDIDNLFYLIRMEAAQAIEYLRHNGVKGGTDGLDGNLNDKKKRRGRPKKVTKTKVMNTIEECQGNKSEAARRLEISPRTLYRVLKGKA